MAGGSRTDEGAQAAPPGHHGRVAAASAATLGSSPRARGPTAFATESESLAQPQIHADQARTTPKIARQRFFIRRWVRIQQTVLRLDQTRLRGIRRDARAAIE